MLLLDAATMRLNCEYRYHLLRGGCPAQTNIGLMYAHGQGVKQNYGEAVKWYRLAAAQGMRVRKTIWVRCIRKGKASHRMARKPSSGIGWRQRKGLRLPRTVLAQCTRATCPPNTDERIQLILGLLNVAGEPKMMNAPPPRFHALSGDRKGNMPCRSQGIGGSYLSLKGGTRPISIWSIITSFG